MKRSTPVARCRTALASCSPTAMVTSSWSRATGDSGRTFAASSPSHARGSNLEHPLLLLGSRSCAKLIRDSSPAEIELRASDQLATYKLLDIPTRILLTEFRRGDSHRYHLSIDGSDLRQDLGSYPTGFELITVTLREEPRRLGEPTRCSGSSISYAQALLWERSKARYSDFPLLSLHARSIRQALEKSSDDPPLRAPSKPETRAP